MKKILLGGLFVCLLLTSACVHTANIGGTWKYALVDDQNLPIPNTTKTVVLTQDDGSFSGNPTVILALSLPGGSLDQHLRNLLNCCHIPSCRSVSAS